MTRMVRLHTKLSSPATGSAEWPPDDRLRRVIQSAAASQFYHRRLRILDRPIKPGDDSRTCVRILATHCARGLQVRRGKNVVLRHAMTARRSGYDWLRFHRRKHGQTRSKSSKTRAGAAAHKGDSEGQIVDAKGVKAQITRVEGQQAQIRKTQT
jgi:hypothetical protein